MKVSRKSVKSKAHAIPEIQFQDQQLSSYSGLTLHQLLFSRLNIREKIAPCFSHLNGDALSYSYGIVTLVLIVPRLADVYPRWMLGQYIICATLIDN
jgi:hypothetical protein